MGSKKKHDTVGRNDPCPCRSGKKYKKCHGFFQPGEKSSVAAPNSLNDQMNMKLAEMKAQMAQREKQQGKIL